MPVNKDALNRIRYIDKMLSDPLGSYTTEDIWRRVNHACGDKQREVTLRMIQKDINAIEEQFEKIIVRESSFGGKRFVRYEDQSQPIFNQQLTDEEAVILHQALKTLGCFDGLDNLQWLEALRKRLNEKVDGTKLPIISFSHNERLRSEPRMLGRLFSMIAHKIAIDVVYQPFGAKTRHITLSPYQLKQYNDRWFLIGTPEGSKEYSFDPEFIINLALDRIVDFTECENLYKEPVDDLKDRFDQIVGVSFLKDSEIEEVLFAASPTAIPYIETKPIHITQMRYPDEEQTRLRNRYPKLEEFTFYSIECRPNYELYSILASFQNQLRVVEPKIVVDTIVNNLMNAQSLYKD